MASDGGWFMVRLISAVRTAARESPVFETVDKMYGGMRMDIVTCCMAE